MDAQEFFPSDEVGALQPCEIYVDEEGDWYYKEARIVRQDIIELFLGHIVFNDQAGFLIELNNRQCLLEAADTPFVISRVDRAVENTKEEKMILRLKYLQEPELLDPGTLYVGKDNVLYCRVLGGRFPARFSRPAYYQLTQWIQEDPQDGSFFIEINGQRHPILMTPHLSRQ